MSLEQVYVHGILEISNCNFTSKLHYMTIGNRKYDTSQVYTITHRCNESTESTVFMMN